MSPPGAGATPSFQPALPPASPEYLSPGCRESQAQAGSRSPERGARAGQALEVATAGGLLAPVGWQKPGGTKRPPGSATLLCGGGAWLALGLMVGHVLEPGQLGGQQEVPWRGRLPLQAPVSEGLCWPAGAAVQSQQRRVCGWGGELLWNAEGGPCRSQAQAGFGRQPHLGVCPPPAPAGIPLCSVPPASPAHPTPPPAGPQLSPLKSRAWKGALTEGAQPFQVRVTTNPRTRSSPGALWRPCCVSFLGRDGLGWGWKCVGQGPPCCERPGGAAPPRLLAPPQPASPSCCRWLKHPRAWTRPCFRRTRSLRPRGGPGRATLTSPMTRTCWQTRRLEVRGGPQSRGVPAAPSLLRVVVGLWSKRPRGS